MSEWTPERIARERQNVTDYPQYRVTDKAHLAALDEIERCHAEIERLKDSLDHYRALADSRDWKIQELLQELDNGAGA